MIAQHFVTYQALPLLAGLFFVYYAEEHAMFLKLSHNDVILESL